MRLSSLSDWGSYFDGGFRSPRKRFSVRRGGLRSFALFCFWTTLSAVGVVAAVRGGSLLPSEKGLPVVVDRVTTTGPRRELNIPTMQVLIARRKIEKGTPLDPSLFIVTKRARSILPSGTVVQAKELEGTYAAVTIPARYPLVEDYVADDRANHSVMRKIPDGSRAVTIHTSTINSVEGWARAGSKVDVQWIGQVNGQLYSKIVVQSAEVLSIERNLKSTQSGTEAPPATVTLLVSEADAERLTVVTGIGDLILQLRGSEDSGDSLASRGVLKEEDLFVRRIPSVNDRLQGVARIPGKEDGKETWALLDGKWVKHNGK